MNKREFYRYIIVENSMNPQHLVTQKPQNYFETKTENKSCNDDYQVYVKIDKDKIIDILFQGHGCAISKAALNLLATYLKNKEITVAKQFLENYQAMIKGQIFETKPLKDLIALENVRHHFNRIPCALIGAQAIKQILEQYGS